MSPINAAVRLKSEHKLVVVILHLTGGPGTHGSEKPRPQWCMNKSEEFPPEIRNSLLFQY